MTASDRDALHSDLAPVVARVRELATKYRVAPTTVLKHAKLIAVPVPGLDDWDKRIAGERP